MPCITDTPEDRTNERAAPVHLVEKPYPPSTQPLVRPSQSSMPGDEV